MAAGTLRLARPGDAPSILEVYAPYVRDTAITFETEVPGEDEMRSRIADILSYSAYLVCEQGGRVLGYAYGSRFRTRLAYRWSAEVTVYVRSEFRRRGLGRALYTSLFECLRLQGYVTAVGVIALPNPESVALHERLGFMEVGTLHAIGHKLGRWHDVGWYERELQTPPESPGPTRPPSALEALPEWSDAVSAGVKWLK